MENLNLKDGDVITLSSGEKVTVSLTPVKEELLIEEGKWYKNKSCQHLWFVEQVIRNCNSNPHKAYGIDGRGDWSISDYRNLFVENYRLATKEEIESALINEAIKRGFIAGVKLAGTGINSNFSGLYPISGKFTYYNSNILDSDGNGHIFHNGNWAELLPQSILEGKVAVKVSNQREQDAFLSHFKIPKLCNLSTCSGYGARDIYFQNQEWGHCDRAYYERLDYKILTFEVFAKENGIEVPKFIIRSEDGVDLYDKDIAIWVISSVSSEFKWKFAYSLALCENHKNIIENKDTYRIFASEEKAREWVAEQNKPKQLHYAILKHNTCSHYYLTELFANTSSLEKAIEKITRRDNSHLHELVSIDI